jgi:hypothetical protein
MVSQGLGTPNLGRENTEVMSGSLIMGKRWWTPGLSYLLSRSRSTTYVRAGPLLLPLLVRAGPLLLPLLLPGMRSYG